MLKVPHANSQLLEFLGGITMVCFVDEDVICEGYSVSEEIFLLNNNTQQAKSNKRFPDTAVNTTDSASSKTRTKLKSIDFSSEEFTVHDDREETAATTTAITTSQSNGLILDLHANPEAHGSRFENPQWWQYLPNLKPIGLNAMLTYSPLGIKSEQQNLLAEQNQATALTNQRNANINTPTQTVSEDSEQPSDLLKQPNTIHERSIHKSSRRIAKMSNKRLNNTSYIEKSLVSHVRESIPLESLRELAEEIGLKNNDCNIFHKVLEMNVIAPGLIDARMAEDTHAWGQEETRRRGSLMTQVRSSLVLDARSEGLQMLSQGDPTLIMHYCSEYWDGVSISPFSSSGSLYCVTYIDVFVFAS